MPSTSRAIALHHRDRQSFAFSAARPSELGIWAAPYVRVGLNLHRNITKIVVGRRGVALRWSRRATLIASLCAMIIIAIFHIAKITRIRLMRRFSSFPAVHKRRLLRVKAVYDGRKLFLHWFRSLLTSTPYKIEGGRSFLVPKIVAFNMRSLVGDVVFQQRVRVYPHHNSTADGWFLSLIFFALAGTIGALMIIASMMVIRSETKTRKRTDRSKK